MHNEQMMDYPTCQICGHNTTADQTEGWLIAPRWYDATLYVIRCPRHISEWSLRESIGRTAEGRRMMREGKNYPSPPVPPLLSPYVMGLQDKGK